MIEIDYKHTWQVRRGAWYVRFFLWLWRAGEDDATLCKMFWGYVGVLPGLVIHALVSAGRAVTWCARRLAKRLVERLTRRYVEPAKVKDARIFIGGRVIVGRKARFGLRYMHDGDWVRAWRLGDQPLGDKPAAVHRFQEVGPARITCLLGPSFITSRPRELTYEVDVRPVPVEMRMLNGVGQGAAKGVMSLEPVASAIGKGLKVTGRGVAAVVGPVGGPALDLLATPFGWRQSKEWRAACGVVYALLTLASIGATAVGIVAAVGGDSAALAGRMLSGALTGALVVGSTFVALGVVLGVVLAVLLGKEKQVQKKLTRPVGGFGHMMLLGYKAVKSNTCPKIELVDE